MIICFSGTGNSLQVAQELAMHLGEHVVEIRDGVKLPQSLSGRIVWVFPCHSWGVPPVVERAIRQYDCNKQQHYAVITCGDDIGLTHRSWRKLITKCGGTACNAFSVQMPNTYVAMKGFDVDAPELAKSKLAAASNRVLRISESIKAGSTADDVVTGRFAWLKTAVIRPWFLRYAMQPRKFHVEESCVGCGKCAVHCPLGNITMRNGRPEWGDNCALCLGCYHCCPRHAINYGNQTVGKGQYINNVLKRNAKP